jgi:hypothetical protein
MTTAIDYRRTDQRTNVLENPFWITSGVVHCVAADDLSAILFSFPKAGQTIIVKDVIVENLEVLDTGVTVNIGLGTIATDAVTTGGTVTETDRDEFIKPADTVLTALAKWGSTTGANASDWLTAAASGTWAAPRILTGAASAVPVILSYNEKSGTIATGTFRVHMLITIVPGT